MRIRHSLAALVVAAACAIVALVPAPPIGAAGDPVNAYLDSIRNEPAPLAAFLHDMPKGADLHMHLSGATSTETLLRFAVEDGLCIDASFVAVDPPCVDGLRKAAETGYDKAFRNAVIAAWSMKGFEPGGETGHDHFFATFGKFGRAGDGHAGEMLAEVAARAAAQHEYYIEPLATPGFDAAEALAQKVGYDADFTAMRKRMVDHGAMDRIVTQASKEVEATFKQFRSVLHCNSRTEADVACELPIRLDYQVLRAFPP